MKLVSILILLPLVIDAEFSLNKEYSKTEVKFEGKGKGLKNKLKGKAAVIRCLVTGVKKMSSCVKDEDDKNPKRGNWDCESTRRSFWDLWDGFKNNYLTNEDSFLYDDDNTNAGDIEHFMGIASCFKASVHEFITCMEQKAGGKRNLDKFFRAVEEHEQNEEQQEETTENVVRRNSNKTVTDQPMRQASVNTTS